MRVKIRWLLAALLLATGLMIIFSGQIAPEGPVRMDSVSLGLLLLDAEEGVYVLAVSEGSIADAAGFMPGDRILGTDDVPLDDVTAFNERLLTAPETLLLTVRRDAQELRLSLPCR